jgi:hypothetical protein
MRAAALLALLLLGGCAGRAPPPAAFGTVAGAPELSCVPFARALSGVALRGDAHAWWEAAAGRYGRTRAPAPGAVLVLARTRALPQGHLAVVLRATDSRTIEVAHANWGRGRDKGRVETGVPIVDVSAGNDWSLVRVWYEPIGGIGTGAHPAHGFILPPAPRASAMLAADVLPAARRARAGGA